MKVYAPNENYTGVSASVAFCNGRGGTSDPRLLEWFRSHGYNVGGPEGQKPEGQKPEGQEPEKRAPKKAGG